MDSTADARFRDLRSTVYDYLDLVLVRCPRCAGAARVVRVPGDDGPGGRRLFATRRLVCGGCGLFRTSGGVPATLPHGAAGPGTDPYFGRPLQLRRETRHGLLWAYNLDHLDLIRRFAGASLRERAPWYDTGRKMTLVARLPVWVKRAGNRDEVLRALDRMRAGAHVEDGGA